jgi:multiple sugar transport system permease protein
MVQRNSSILIASIAILTVMLILTLIPLMLMFYTSAKTGGTLFESTKDIAVANFDIGTTNSIGGPIATRQTENALITFEYLPGPTEGGRFVEVKSDTSKGGEAIFWTRLGQDMRKFKTIEFDARGLSGNEKFLVGLEDVRGRYIEVPIEKYTDGGLSTSWQRIVIPLTDFKLKNINPELREKNAENFYIKFNKPGVDVIQIDNVKFNFKSFTLDNYTDVLISGPFGRYFFNSILITFFVVFGNIIFSSMVGYAFARKEFPFKKALFMMVIGSLMVPTQVLMVPVFILIKNLGWLNTYWALTLPALLCPFNIFLMRQYISKLPASLEDAARIDGASDLQIFFKVVMPLARPALAVIGINAFMGSWNTFIYPFILTNTPEMRTLPVGLALYKSLQGVDWVHLMAGSSITALPVIIVFLMFQRNIIAGLTAGSTKG